MLKTVSAITNAIGALNYKGTWNASTNTPALVSGTGTKGDYYVVSVPGTTALDGISNWGVGDWTVFNGSAWQRVEGGADLNGVNLSVSGTSTLGDNATFSTAGKGVDFSANAHAAGMTSELLNWYEEGTWTPSSSTPNITISSAGGNAQYTRVGRLVTARCFITVANSGAGITGIVLTGLPFNSISFGIARMHYSSVGAVDTGNMYVNDSGNAASLDAFVAPAGNRTVMMYFEYYTS